MPLREKTYIRDGFVSAGNAEVTGSLGVTGGITGSLQGTASYVAGASVDGAVGNSTRLNGQAAAYYLNASNINTGTLSNSYLPSSINITSVTASLKGDLTGTASYATQALSASYAPSTSTPTFPYTGSATISGSLAISSPPGNSITYIGDSSQYPGLSVLNFGATTPTNTNWFLRGDQSNAAINGMGGRLDVNINGYLTSALFYYSYILFGGSLMIGDSSFGTTPSATLQLKGSGTTSATTTFLVQNSSPSTLFKITDNGKTLIGSSTYSYTSANNGLIITAPNESNDYQGNLEIFTTDAQSADKGGSIVLGGIQSSITYPFAKIVGAYEGTSTYSGYLSFLTEAASSALYERMRITSTGNVGIGVTAPAARLQLKGSGTTSSTTTFLVQNSTPSTLFQITDNGATTISGSLGVTGSISLNNATSTGIAGYFKNNAYNLGGNNPVIIDDSGPNVLGLGYGGTAAGRIWTPSAGIYISGFGGYGVYFETSGFVSSGKCRIGDSQYNTGTTLEVVGSGTTSATSNFKILDSSMTIPA